MLMLQLLTACKRIVVGFFAKKMSYEYVKNVRKWLFRFNIARILATIKYWGISNYMWAFGHLQDVIDPTEKKMFKGDILGSASKHNFPLLPNSAMEHKSWFRNFCSN